MAVYSRTVTIPGPLTSCWWSNALYATTKSNVMMSQHRIITKRVLVNQQSPIIKWYLIISVYFQTVSHFETKPILISMHCNVHTTRPHNCPHLLYTTLHTRAQTQHACVHTWTHTHTVNCPKWNTTTNLPTHYYTHTTYIGPHRHSTHTTHTQRLYKSPLHSKTTYCTSKFTNVIKNGCSTC